MKRAKEILGALWALATIITGFYSFAHIESTFWLFLFFFFLSACSIVIGFQMFFWTESQYLSNRHRYWTGNKEFNEISERWSIKYWLPYYRFRGIMGMVVGTAILVGLGISSVSYFTIMETDQLTVRALENKLSSLESSEVSYYRNSNDCKKLMYAKNWFAEPRSYECGSSDDGHYPAYGEFSSEAESLFEKVSDVLDIGGVRFAEAKIDYSSDAKIKRAEFLFDTSVSRFDGYLYEPYQEHQAKEKNPYLRRVSENWYKILSHSSPF